MTTGQELLKVGNRFVSVHIVVNITLFLHDFIRGATFSHADNHAHSIIEGKFAKMLTREIMAAHFFMFVNY